MSNEELFERAKALVIESQKASLSGLQRQLDISMNEAQSLMEQLEAAAVVSPLGENNRREVLIGNDESDEPDEDSADGVVEADDQAEDPDTTEADEADPAEEQPEGWDAEEEHETAIDRMESIGDDLDLDTEELVADVRDFLLDTIKARPKPWSGTSQAEQRDVIASCEHNAKELVRGVVEAVAARGVQPVRMLLTKVTMGNDTIITGKLKAYDEEEEDRAIKILHSSLQKHVMITAASVEDYQAEGRDVDGDPDEPDLEFEADSDEVIEDDPDSAEDEEDEDTEAEAEAEATE